MTSPSKDDGMREALEAAQRIVDTYDAYVNGGVSEGRAESAYIDARRKAPSVARALLSSSAAASGVGMPREADAHDLKWAMDRLYKIEAEATAENTATSRNDAKAIIMVLEEIDHLQTALLSFSAVVGALEEWDKWDLVIESAIRNDAPSDHAAILRVIKKSRDALSALSSSRSAGGSEVATRAEDGPTAPTTHGNKERE